MRLDQLLLGLQFHNDFRVDDEISEEVPDDLVLIINSNRLFSFNPQSSVYELNNDGVMVDAFDKSIAKAIVYLIEDSDDLFGQLFFNHYKPLQFEQLSYFWISIFKSPKRIAIIG